MIRTNPNSKTFPTNNTLDNRNKHNNWNQHRNTEHPSPNTENDDIKALIGVESLHTINTHVSHTRHTQSVCVCAIYRARWLFSPRAGREPRLLSSSSCNGYISLRDYLGLEPFFPQTDSCWTTGCAIVSPWPMADVPSASP